MKNFFNTLLKYHWDALLAALVGIVVIYYLTRFGGIGISPDSVAYTTAAINLKEHFQFVDFNGLPLVAFPAGYPFFLAFAYAVTGISPIALAPFLNAFLYAGVLLMSSYIIQGFTYPNKWYKAAMLTILATSTCLWDVYGMVWSETLFIFLTLLFMLAWRWYAKKQSLFFLGVFALITAVAFVTRFAGITLLATGVALIFFDGSIEKIKKLKHLFLFFILGISLVLINLIHNSHTSGSLAGVREKAQRSVVDNLGDIGGVIGTWLPFVNDHTKLGAIIFVALIIGAAMVVFFRLLQQQFYHRNETIVAGYFFVYAVFIVIISSISRFEELSSRLLSPLYIPMLLVVSYWIPKFIHQKTKGTKNLIRLFCIVYFTAFLWNQYQQNAANWEGIADAGIPGYSEKQWTESPMAQYINGHKDSLTDPIYSDASDGLYYLTGLRSMPLPHNEVVIEQKAFLQKPKLIIVWFNDGENIDLIDIAFIKKHKQLTATRNFTDGTIYFFSDSIRK